jgi:AcrR family transcriptional regulator
MNNAILDLSFQIRRIRFGCKFFNLSFQKCVQGGMKTETKCSSKMGRPRGFDEDVALEAAMRVFWAKSYEGATMADLTEAMGINRSSMYAAFGDKESLFRLAIERYRNGPMTYVKEALALPTLRETVVALLNGSVDFLGTPGNPRGCLSLQGALASGTVAEPAKDAMIEWRKQGEAVIRKRVQQAQRDGDLDKAINPTDFAHYLSVLMSGIGVQAANGATKAEMKRYAEMALRFMGY